MLFAHGLCRVHLISEVSFFQGLVNSHLISVYIVSDQVIDNFSFLAFYMEDTS